MCCGANAAKVHSIIYMYLILYTCIHKKNIDVSFNIHCSRRAATSLISLVALAVFYNKIMKRLLIAKATAPSIIF
jgi:hypothetical protein